MDRRFLFGATEKELTALHPGVLLTLMIAFGCACYGPAAAAASLSSPNVDTTQSSADLNKACIKLFQTTGTLLDRYSIQVASSP